jgi:hypothetical protein
MSQEHAERGEIGVGQIGQDFDVNGVFAECLLVLVQARPCKKLATSMRAFSRLLSGELCGTRPRVSSAPRAPRDYWFSQRRMNPRRPWGMKITIAMKISPSGIR